MLTKETEKYVLAKCQQQVPKHTELREKIADEIVASTIRACNGDIITQSNPLTLADQILKYFPDVEEIRKQVKKEMIADGWYQAVPHR